MLVRDTGIEVGYSAVCRSLSDQRRKPLSWRTPAQYRVSQAEASGTSGRLSGTYWARNRRTDREQPMARKTSGEFATIRQLPSGRWQVRYTGPDGIRRTAPHTFADRDRRRGVRRPKRREIDREAVGRRPTTTARAGHFRRLRRPLAGEPASGRPTDQGPHPRALQRDPRRPPTAGVR